MMIRSSTVCPPTKPLVPCVGCGEPIAKYSDVEKGHLPYDSERGFVCVLCKKTVCSQCLYHSDLLGRVSSTQNPDRRLSQLYGLLAARAVDLARDRCLAYVCKRCVAVYEMKLIRNIGYQDLPLYVNVKWLTQAATKYYRGILEGRYECPSPNTPVKT